MQYVFRVHAGREPITARKDKLLKILERNTTHAAHYNIMHV